MRLFCKQVSPAGDGPGVPVGRLVLRCAIAATSRPPMHPGWLRCSSLTYSRYAALLTPCQPGASTPETSP
jgi:hypothetical protein